MMMLSTSSVIAVLSLLVGVDQSEASQHNANSANNNGGNNRKKAKDDYLVTELQSIEPAYAEFDGQMYSGLIPIDNGSYNGETMFWMFEPSKQKVPDSIVVWLNGGPGCSSFNCGVLMEHSPVTQPLHDAGYCCLNDHPPLSPNKHTWTRATTMVYIEHPIGTGFSFGTRYPEDEWEASQDFYIFLQNFFDIFDHLRSYKLYVMGESYAGMFVPIIGYYIHQQNQKNIQANEPNKVVNLQGLGIGNGWMNGYVQGPAVIDYSWYHGLIDEPTRKALKMVWDKCMEGEKKHSNSQHDIVMDAPFHNFNVQDDCGMMWGVLEAAGQPNAYDITTWDPNVDQVTFSSEAFYNNISVKEALHAPNNITWHGCQVGSGRRRKLFGKRDGGDDDHQTTGKQQQRRGGGRKLYMDNDEPINVVPYVASLLDAGIRTVIYNGDRDMTTNMVGTERILNDMKWSGKANWWDAPRGLWKVNDYPAGWAKEYKDLTFVVVYNSGHMVPYNQPVPAYDLLTRLLEGSSFIDDELPQIRFDKSSATAEATVKNAEMDTRLGTTMIASLAFGAGILAAFTIIGICGRRHNNNLRKKSGYESIPETELEGGISKLFRMST